MLSDGSEDDRFHAVEDGPEVEIRVKGSRFLGRAASVASERGAAEVLATARRRDHDATHHCSAYRVGHPGACRARFDDDGEPAGTAGRPILRAIEGRDVYDVLVVVTRWFGGTKLGTGGLARAYGEAAAAALARAPVRDARVERLVRVECAFDDLGAVESTLASAGRDAVVLERRFEPRPRFEVAVLRAAADVLRDRLTEATAGRAVATVGDIRIGGRLRQ